MASVALANALKDFGAVPPVHAEIFPAPSPFPALPESELPMFPDLPDNTSSIDTEALVAEAVADAELKLTERLNSEHNEILEAQRERHAQDIAEIQQEFAEQASAKISASIEEMEKHVLELTSAVAARILGAILTDDVRDRSIEKLADIIRAALNDEDAVRIRVRGSQPLFDALTAKLPAYADQLDFAESSNFDLSVTIDDSVFETRLAEWSNGLAEALSE